MSACFISGARVYRPRNPRATKLYRLVSDNYDRFLEVYPRRFENKYGYLRPEVKRTMENYLRCGILSYGFARVKCESCHQEFLLAFSCKGRYFCPSCHQRRVLEFSLFLTDHILEAVPHRQIVFSIPKMLRIYFLYNRSLLPKLSHCGWETVKEVFQATLGRDDITPGMVMDIQTYGRWANWHPHLHGLVSDGCFDEEGNFYPMPRISAATLEKVFTTKVLAMLLMEDAITDELAEKILSWRHSGFNAHAKVLLEQGDREGLQSLAQYIVRCPISEEKLLLSPDGKTVIYKSSHKPEIKKNFEVYDVLEFLAALSSHIPAVGKKMVIYYGWYAHAARGKRKRDGKPLGEVLFHQVDDDNRILRYRWSQLIKMIYADPLICSHCGGRMKIIAFIRDKVVIERILKHLGLSEELPHSHSPPATGPPEPRITYEPFYDDLPLDEQAELAQTVR